MAQVYDNVGTALHGHDRGRLETEWSKLVSWSNSQNLTYLPLCRQVSCCFISPAYLAAAGEGLTEAMCCVFTSIGP